MSTVFKSKTGLFVGGRVIGVSKQPASAASPWRCSDRSQYLLGWPWKTRPPRTRPNPAVSPTGVKDAAA
jgi:hypothetical protein